MQLLQQGVRIAMGAIASWIETWQDPQKRVEAIAFLQTELEQKTKEWLAKGEITEEEVKAFMNSLTEGINLGDYNFNATKSQKKKTLAHITSQIQELTADIIALKLELEKLRQLKDR